ncbi:MAG: homocysteine S-methyltransferase family protein [Victivallales bacterium]|nr:homocysteine S-methyltransferase family protein [Victivallales bacterium]
MTTADFSCLCRRGMVVLDGATGTELAKHGLPAGVCPEAWILEHPEAIHAVQSAYETAGSQIVYAPTFGANRLKLAEFGLEKRTAELNRRLAEIARTGLSHALVFGDIAPTGKFVEPFGDLPFETVVDVYKEQARALLDGGVDGFAVETMMDLQEARAALIAIREICELPVLVTMTFDASGRTLTGNTPASAIVALQALGASAVGCNCSTGPDQMAGLVAQMAEYARVPIVAKPNAGMPRLDVATGKTVFDMQAEEFGSIASRLVEVGAGVVGGCCGTTPAHIKCLAQAVSNLEPPELKGVERSFVSSATTVLSLGEKRPFSIIGERLNPTGKKALQAELRGGVFDLVRRFAKEQAEAGAVMLDVNCGLPGIDETATLRKVVSILSAESQLPLCIDTTNPATAEAALRLYPGRALFNSISAEKNRLEKVLPIAAKYGALIIALPLDDEGIPPTVAGRAERVNRIFNTAQKYGYNKSDMVVDGLVMTVSTNQEAAVTTLNTIDWAAHDFGCGTVCGLSNVSFGLPRRDLVNRAFLGAAIGKGLTMVIANPMNADIMEMVYASNVLFGRDANASSFIAKYGNTAVTATPVEKKPVKSSTEAIRQFLLEGDINAMSKAIDEALAEGTTASDIVDKVLIPAVAEVGDKYERHEFFLPQLMAGAMAMQAGMAKLESLLAAGRKDGTSAGKIVIATVKGDIHDIGKNIVAMMLKNYGFEVIDLGKDVPAEVILDRAIAEGTTLVALSALMTTTMGEMKNVIELAKKRGLELHFIVGGAVVDEEFAASIGAEYASDAMATVRCAQKIMALKE